MYVHLVEYLIVLVCSLPQADITADITNCLVYLDNYIYYAGLSRKVDSFDTFVQQILNRDMKNCTHNLHVFKQLFVHLRLLIV